MTSTNSRALVDGEFVPIVSDTEVYQDGDGYERMLLVHFEQNTLVKAHIRVDKAPENSFAIGEIWVPATGWNRIAVLPANEWWKSVPGYLRWAKDSSDAATYKMLIKILEAMLKVPLG